MFEFTHPYIFYGGVAAGAIPIIIHLIFRHRFQRIKWAAMKFLLNAYQKTRTSLLIENLLLLILRVIILLLLAFAFSRPVIRTELSALKLVRTTQHFMIVLDNSYSMGFRYGNTTPFDQAKEQGRRIFSMLKSGDSVTLITMNSAPKVILSFYTDLKEALQKFEEIELSHLGTDVVETITLINSQVSKKEFHNKNVFIITDFQKNPWVEASKSKSFTTTFNSIQDNATSLSLIDVGSIRRPENMGITNLISDGVVGTGIYSRFVATIENLGPSRQENFSVKFFVDGNPQGSQSIKEIPGFGRQDIPLLMSFDTTGPHYIMAELSSDNLPIDNKRYFAFDVIKNIKLLAIDGDVKEKAFESETDYFMAAIGPSEKEKNTNLIQAESIDVTLLSPGVQFKNYDILVLANVKILPIERIKEIEEFVSNGGGLWIFLGDKVEDTYQDYNSDLYKDDGTGLLPGYITGKPVGDARDRENPYKLVKIATNHKIWQYFKSNTPLLQDLQNAYFFRFFPVKPHSKTEVLAYYSDPVESPAILLHSYGKGKVLLFTTTADGAWTNLNTDQFGHVYLVMVHEFVQYLFTKPLDSHNITIKSPIERVYDYQIYRSPEQQSVDIILPSQDREPVGVTPDKEGKLFKVQYLDTDWAGIYTFKLNIPKDVLDQKPSLPQEDYFAVNVDPKEGVLERLTPKELTQLFPSIKFNYTENFQQSQGGEEGKRDIELWKWVIPLVITLAVLESILAMWFGKYEK